MMIAAPALAKHHPPATTGGLCAPTKSVADLLTSDKHNEQAAFTGVTFGGKVVVRIWVNPKTGAWTVTESNTHGVTCIRGAGKLHELEDIVAPDDA